jgi:UDP-GlcNAc3NAcA epimerase
MKILTVVGARPQFVKAAVVSRAFAMEGKIEEKIIHTGQHYDENMSDLFFSEMNIPRPFANLGINQMNPDLLIESMVAELKKQIRSISPNAVLVYGDTYSTLAGAISANETNTPLVHVEAGLRSFNMEMPEERNRVITDRFSNLLFCPTKTAIENLKNETGGVSIRNVLFSGDVMFDAMLYYKEKAMREVSIFADFISNDFVLCTFHRHENIENDDHLRAIVNSLNAVHSNIPVVCPLHPHSAKRIHELGLKLDFQVIAPVGYFEMIRLLDACKLVITDSGGLQKEAYFSKKICVCLREVTEWVELVNDGYVLLTGLDEKLIMEAINVALKSSKRFEEAYYGDGNAGEFISKNIFNLL